jgi:hypothetical protein
MSRTMTTLFAALLLAGTVAAAPPPPPPQGPSGGPVEPNGAPPMTAPMPASTAVPTADPHMLARAKSWFAMIQAGKIDRSQLNASANEALTDAKVTAAQSAVGSLGTPVSFVQQRAGSQGSINYAIYLLTFQNGQKLSFLFAVDQQGKVAGLQFMQPQ